MGTARDRRPAPPLPDPPARRTAQPGALRRALRPGRLRPPVGGHRALLRHRALSRLPDRDGHLVDRDRLLLARLRPLPVAVPAQPRVLDAGRLRGAAHPAGAEPPGRARPHPRRGGPARQPAHAGRGRVPGPRAGGLTALARQDRGHAGAAGGTARALRGVPRGRQTKRSRRRGSGGGATAGATRCRTPPGRVQGSGHIVPIDKACAACDDFREADRIVRTGVSRCASWCRSQPR